MAAFRIHNDTENHQDIMRPKTKNGLKNSQRTALGVVNGNQDAAQNSKISVQMEPGSVKSFLNNGLQMFNENAKRLNENQVKAKSKTFQVFEDDSSCATENHGLKKNEAKTRVLKDRKIVPQFAVSKNNYQGAVKFPQPSLPEPMSPDDSDASMSMDVSLKIEKEFVSKASEAAAKDLDHFKLTQRLYVCEEYRDEISSYLKSLQVDRRPRKNYMAKQPDITHSMRSILVDWLVEVIEEYNMTTETLYLAVSYIDRFLSSMSVVRSKLQLVGTAAMFIAAKYEEIYPPEVKDFVYITDDTYTKSQVLRMEHLILRVLQFDLSSPTILNFLMDYTSHYETPDNVKYLAMYLCELTLVEGDTYLGMLPSEIAAGALCVARATLLPDVDVMPPQLQQIMDVHLTDIMHVIAALERTFRSAETNVQQASREKYKTDRFLKVSTSLPPTEDCSSLLSKDATPS